MTDIYFTSSFLSDDKPALQLDNGMCPVKLVFRLDVVGHVVLILKKSEIGLMIVYACRKCCQRLLLGIMCYPYFCHGSHKMQAWQ